MGNAVMVQPWSSRVADSAVNFSASSSGEPVTLSAVPPIGRTSRSGSTSTGTGSPSVGWHVAGSTGGPSPMPSRAKPRSKMTSSTWAMPPCTDRIAWSTVVLPVAASRGNVVVGAVDVGGVAEAVELLSLFPRAKIKPPTPIAVMAATIATTTTTSLRRDGPRRAAAGACAGAGTNRPHHEQRLPGRVGVPHDRQGTGGRRGGEVGVLIWVVAVWRDARSMKCASVGEDREPIAARPPCGPSRARCTGRIRGRCNA